MKITVTGNLYSGKSCLSRRLAEHYGLRLYSVGLLQRAEADKLNMSIDEYNDYMKANKLDNLVDYNTASVGKTEKDFIFDARMAWHFIPDSIKICLNVSIKEASKRAVKDTGRGPSEGYRTEEQARDGILSRQGKERERFIKLYDVDKQMIDNYDLVVDTSVLTPDQTFEVVKRYIDGYLETVSNR